MTETLITLQIFWIGLFLILSCLAYFLLPKAIKIAFKDETDNDD